MALDTYGVKTIFGNLGCLALYRVGCTYCRWRVGSSSTFPWHSFPSFSSEQETDGPLEHKRRTRQCDDSPAKENAIAPSRSPRSRAGFTARCTKADSVVRCFEMGAFKVGLVCCP